MKEIEMITMNITRALAEIKRLDDRITRALSAQFVGVTIGQNTKMKMAEGNKTPAQAQAEIQSAADSLQSMFAQRASIKAKVVASNAVTTVQLGNEVLTVAEAIERKKSIEFKRKYVATLQAQLNRANTDVKTHNDKLETVIETNLATIYGNDKGKVEAGMYEAIAKPQRETKEAALLDPLKVVDLVAKLQEEVSLIDTELDYLLSTSNAMTVIEV
jgi:hypothetical protein